MDVIIQPNKAILQMLPNQKKVKGKKYRLNKFCVFSDLGNGDKLIFNEMTKSLIRIRPEEFNNIYTDEQIDYVNFLYRNYFLVTQDFDEIQAVENYRNKQRMPITDSYLDTVNSFTILTTTKCNARCFYCYEKTSNNKHHMTEETARKVAQYIIDKADKRQQIKLNWFGGEPLFNANIIDIITQILRASGINYISTMISNGYLLNQSTISKAIQDWNLKSVQITLDGTEEKYNKIKNYIYKNVNPFQVVKQNIKDLLDNKINVSIRMNVDLYNVQDIRNLIIQMSKEFDNYKSKGFSMYLAPIFEQDGYVRTSENRAKLFQYLQDLQQLLVDTHLNYLKLVGNIKAIHCMVDAGNGVMISPDGNVGLCEHYIDSDFFSHIDTPDQKDWAIIKSWRNYKPAQEMCKTCPLYPACLKVIKCSDEMDCDEAQKQYNLFRERMAMHLEWDKFKNRSKKNNRQCCSIKKQKAKPLSLWEKIKVKLGI